MIYWSYECSGWEESHMADVYKQSFKQNYTNNIELSIFNCGLERCAPGQTWGPASGTITSSIWSFPAREPLKWAAIRLRWSPATSFCPAQPAHPLHSR